MKGFFYLKTVHKQDLRGESRSVNTSRARSQGGYHGSALWQWMMAYSWVSIYFICTTRAWSRRSYYPCLIHEETKARRRKCLAQDDRAGKWRSQSWTCAVCREDRFPRDSRRGKGGWVGSWEEAVRTLCTVFFFTLRTEHCLFTDCAELFLRSVYWGQTQMSLCHRGQGCSFLTANTEELTTGNCSVYLLPSLTFSYCVSILIIRINVSVCLSSLKSNGKE